MESTSTKVEVMKPVLLKAGIPLAIAVAGFIIAKITQRKCSFLQDSHLERPENSPEIHGLDSSESGEESDNHVKWQEEMICLKSRIEVIQGRERELEARFNYYNYLKEQEMLLMELENKSQMEMTKIAQLEWEISMLQRESQRFEKMVAEYMKIMDLLEFSRSENGFLHMKVKRLQKKVKQLSHVVNAKNLQLKGKEAENSRNEEELEKKDGIIKKTVEETKMAMEQLQHERNELLINKLEMAQMVDSSKNDAEIVSMDDYKALVHELEQLQESKAAEEKELIYLRWCNACLRHELMKKNQEYENQNNGEIADFASNDELGSPLLGFPIVGHSHDHSKRKKLVQKFKKWSEKMKHKLDEKEKNETIKCFRNHTHSASAGDLILPARNSSSSA